MNRLFEIPNGNGHAELLLVNNVHVNVFLVSLKAGGVALNLTEASRVFILDPWWNPAVELQAMDRVHRIGQYRPITVTRLIIDNSIESKILELQKKKGSSTLPSTDGRIHDRRRAGRRRPGARATYAR